MAEKKIENKEKLEREYVIPLREKCRHVSKHKRTPKAIKTIKEFLAKHMKVENRDIKKVKLDKLLNESLWNRGIENPLHKVKVKAIKEDGIVHAYAVNLTPSLNFKRIREERKSKEATTLAKSNKKSKENETVEKEESDDKNNNGIKDSKEFDEKKEALKEAEKQIQKETAIKTKHTNKASSKKEELAKNKTRNISSRGH